VTRALSENQIEKELGRHTWSIQRQEFMPLAFRWRTPDIDDPPPTGPTPELENGWAQVDPPLERFAYRLHADGSLEFKGHLDAAGASSGTVALTLPEPVDDEDMEPSYRLPRDQFFLTVIYDGATPESAMVFIEGSSGEVTITWPV
jgi:hypothetical protein